MGSSSSISRSWTHLKKTRQHGFDRGFTTIVSFRVEFLHFVNETETYYCQNLTARAMFSDKTIIFADTAKF